MSRIARTAALGCLFLSGCEVVTPDELAAIRSGDDTGGVQVAQLYRDEIVPYASTNATGLGDLLSRIEASGFDAACETSGVQTSQAVPCAFWVTFEGQIASVNTQSRTGRVGIDLGSGGPDVSVLIGPILPGTAVRDGFPDLDYNDFGDQAAYAELGDELDAAVLDGLAGTQWEIGTAVRVLGVFASWSAPGDSIDVVPVSVERL